MDTPSIETIGELEQALRDRGVVMRVLGAGHDWLVMIYDDTDSTTYASSRDLADAINRAIAVWDAKIV